MQLFKRRRIPQLPSWTANAIWILFALLLVISGLVGMRRAIASGFSTFVVASVLIATSIGILRKRPWAYGVSYGYLLANIAIQPLRSLASGSDGLQRDLMAPLFRLRELPLWTLATKAAMYFNYWGLPVAFGRIAVIALILAILVVARRSLRPALSVTATPINQIARNRKVLSAIAIVSASAIALSIGYVVIIAIGDVGSGSSPGGFGPGYETFFAMLRATPFVLAGAVGLAITQYLRRKGG